MTPEERNLLTDLFRHLREVESQPRDQEAEALIRQLVQAQPLASYYMAQTVLVQQQALTAAQQRIEELERKLKEAESRSQQTPQPSGGSFLSGALGLGRSPWGGARAPEPQQLPQQPQPAQRGPWGAPPPGFGQPAYGQPGYQPGYAPQMMGGQPARGGGFLAGAAQTAAGVAGGMLAASAISSMLSHSPGPFGEAAAGASHAAAGGETIINNFYGDSGAQGGAPTHDVSYDQGAGVQDAGYQSDDPGSDPGFDGGDGGGDDSWI
ncbi:DUF2076 domain-containing protein [Azospirillum thermophilum]|uniref:DUF2076 domain-containing protein n=1 Tax=Azospirillum thermophilum TaxID=2202148 RepID=A0A2S2CXL7_9PROT|nr:DUF2076 domain-containing protein [Azospirillum thermophilum]AWK89226.1 DUF2076 domain-containing protein [Azospirillum thermophilum]